MFKNFKELCNAVEKIDKDAAEYLRGDAKNLRFFRESNRLNCCFGWLESPQGFDYWDNINKQIGGRTDVFI